MDELRTARFFTAEAAKAAGMSAGTLNTRIARGELRVNDDAESLRHPGTGRSRLFSALRVLQIALGERLTRAGIEARKAYDLALAFTDHTSLDNVQGGLLGDTLADPRMLGHVYGEGATLFRVLFPFDSTAGFVASIERVLPADSASSLFLHNHRRYAHVLLIDLGDLRSRVLSVLGV